MSRQLSDKAVILKSRRAREAIERAATLQLGERGRG